METIQIEGAKNKTLEAKESAQNKLKEVKEIVTKRTDVITISFFIKVLI